MSRYRRNYVQGGSYFFTVITYKRQKMLHGEGVDILRQGFRDAIAQQPFGIDAVVVLPDHLHCIWQLPPGDDDYSTRWKKIKTFFTKEYKRRVGGAQRNPPFWDGVQRNPPSWVGVPAQPDMSVTKKGEAGIWQPRFWEHTIRDEDDYMNHFNYIHYNPVKHGWAAAPKDWQYSSFHRWVRKGIYEVEWGAGRDVSFDDNVGKE